MLIARCESCGALYYGCALRYESELSCSKCGASLLLLDSANEAENWVYVENYKSPSEPTHGLTTRES